MSQPFRQLQIIRCPLCRDAGAPIHVGLGVTLCECCGNRFRVVHANPGRTGAKLTAHLKSVMEFAKGT